jgi:hypoxanthine-guanine phosphoribosyltransferase
MLAVNYSLKDEHRHFTFNNELKSVKGLQTKRILLVEDLCDSGKTLEEMCDAHLFGLSVATCVPLYKPHTSCIKPDFYARTYEGNGWVDFAWEKK